jgi:hypothetical protein
MAQHSLLSAGARSLSPGKLMRMSERGAENVFVRLRWPQTGGKPVCPQCGCQIRYDCRCSDHQPRLRRQAAGTESRLTRLLFSAIRGIMIGREPGFVGDDGFASRLNSLHGMGVAFYG